MAIALAVWSLELKAGEKHAQEITPPGDLRITNIALGAELADQKGRTTAKLVYLPVGDSDDEEDEEDEDEETDDAPKGEPVETVLCTLIPGQIEQVNMNVVLPAERPVVFVSIGKNTVHFTGNYVDQLLPDEPPSEDELVDEDTYGMEEGESEEEEEVEEEEEILETTLKTESKKRPREPEALSPAEELLLSKKELKKLKKKLKTNDGEAVPTGEKDSKESSAAGHEKAGKSKKGKEAAEKHKGKGVERELAGGVKILDHKVGEGPKAKHGDTVSMRYVGKLVNGSVFDKNTKGQPFDFVLGDGDVIKGWDVGIVGMQAGGERLLTIPPSMGYGKRAQSDIPANSTLIFEVKLLSIKA